MAIKLILIKMKDTSPTQKGLLTSVLMILAFLFSVYILKNPIASDFQFIIYSIYCFGIVWSLVSYFRSDNEKKSFSNFFTIGFKTFIVVALLMAVFYYFYFSFNPGFNDNQIEENSKKLLLQKNHLPNEIKENAIQLKKMFKLMMTSLIIFWFLILGALITAIAAAFLSNKALPVAKK